LLKPGHSITHYRIVSLLGAGGMGEVYLAEDTRLGRRVALKLLPAAFTSDMERVRRFRREARAASALNHPNIVTVHDIGEDQAGHFITLELVEGRTLREVISDGPDVCAIVPLGSQIAKALSVAHNAGITHRDLKPENIMVRDDGYLKVLDFGLALLSPVRGSLSQAETEMATRAGIILGTVRYMSPEQARGERAGHSSDIFSLGLILYEMAAGRHAFAGDSVLGMLNAITSQAPVPPSRFNAALSGSLERVILQMLEKTRACGPLQLTLRLRGAKKEGGGVSPSPSRLRLLRARAGQSAETANSENCAPAINAQRVATGSSSAFRVSRASARQPWSKAFFVS